MIGTFFSTMCLTPFEGRTEPPFRDPESQLFIQEIDHGHLVDGDWYSYVSTYGRTCMSSLSGGTQYALTLIYNSRRGSYTSYYHQTKAADGAAQFEKKVIASGKLVIRLGDRIQEL